MVVMKTFRGWHCPHCSYISPSQKGNLKVHILNRHANPGESFACMFCGKHLSSRSSLQVHISQVSNVHVIWMLKHNGCTGAQRTAEGQTDAGRETEDHDAGGAFED